MSEIDFRADLHTHSFFSDGSDSPNELIRSALDIGLSGLSITDHDTIDAYAEAMDIASSQHCFLLPGIEFSAFFRGEAVHILGYGFSLNSEEVRNLCLRHKKRREDRNRKILAKLRKLNIRIDEEELIDPRLPNRTIGRPKIAEILVQKEYVPSIRAAFQKYLGEGKAAYSPGEPFTVEETISVIKAGRGKAFLAHPHLLKKSTVIREILKMPFDGIEAYYARFSPEHEKKWIDVAKQNGWITSGGSDYHGHAKPQNILGSSWVGKETFDLLYNHYLNVASTS